MRRTLISSVLIVWVAAGLSYGAEDLGYVPGMVIVRFTPSAMPSRQEVGMEPAAFQKPDLDNILRVHRASRLSRLLRTFGEETLPAGRLLDRTFVIYYDDSTDAQVVVSELAALPYFESVMVNNRLRKHYGGTVRRFEPTDAEFQNHHQWNLDYPSDDRVDIDAPEAWAIERGDSSLVIGIIDLGTMVNLGVGGSIETGPYVLHSDHRFFPATSGAFRVSSATRGVARRSRKTTLTP